MKVAESHHDVEPVAHEQVSPAPAAQHSGKPKSATAIANAGMLQIRRELGATPLTKRFPSIAPEAFERFPAFFQEIRSRFQCDEAQVKRLLAAEAVPDFMRYLLGCAPDLELVDFEISTFLTYRKEVGDVLAYRGKIPHLRNPHRHTKRGLDALVASWQDKSKRRPLRLIVVSGSDHNGAFHRHGGIEAALSHPAHVALLLETQGALEEVEASFGPLAATYGQGNKIDDLILCAHGSPMHMSLGEPGLTSRAAALPQVASAKQAAEAPLKPEHFALQSDDGHPEEAAYTRRFFASALAHLKNDPAHPAAIALLACHSDGAEPVSVPHEHGPGRDRARALIVKQSSIAGLLRGEVKRSGMPVEVIGAAQYHNGDERLLDPKTGALAPLKPGDPAAYSASKLDYVTRGANFVDVFAALQTAWVHERAGLESAMRQRLKQPLSGPWESLVAAMFTILLPQIENPRVINDMHELAATLVSAMGKGGAVPTKLLLSMPIVWRDTLYRGLSGCDAWKDVKCRLPFLQSWMTVDASKDADFFADLLPLSPKLAAAYIYPSVLEPVLPRLLRQPGHAPPAGELKLALSLVCCALDEGRRIPETARRYLLTMLGTGQHFHADLKAYLLDSMTEADILGAIGRGPGVTKGPDPSMISSAVVGKPGRVKAATPLRSGPSDAYAPVEHHPPLVTGMQVVVEKELLEGNRIPASRWFYTLTRHGSGWVRGSEVDLSPAATHEEAAEPRIRPGDTHGPIRVLVSGFADEIPGVENASRLIVAQLANLQLPGVIVTTKILPVSMKAIDAFVDHELRQGQPDIVLGVGQGDSVLAHGIKTLALNRSTTLFDGDGKQGTGAPIDSASDITRRSTLPMERILADQKKLLGKDALGAQGYVGTADTFVCNYLEYRELQAAQGSGAMVGFVHVLDAKKDQAAVVQVIRSSVEEVRERRKTAAARIS